MLNDLAEAMKALDGKKLEELHACKPASMLSS